MRRHELEACIYRVPSKIPVYKFSFYLEKYPLKQAQFFLKDLKKKKYWSEQSPRDKGDSELCVKKTVQGVHKTIVYKSLECSSNTELRFPKFCLPRSLNKILMK